MRILQINAVNGILSTGRTTQELSDELNKLGHESYIAYASGLPASHNTYKIGNLPDRKLHALQSRITGLQGYFSVFATKRLIRYIRNLKPDIVHLRNVHSNYLHLNKLLRFLADQRIATVITLHDCWFYTGRCTHYFQNGCYQWQSCCRKCPNHNNTLPAWFFDRSKKMFLDKKKYLSSIKRLGVIGVSDWITGEVQKSFLSGAAIIKRIYNWVNLDIFKPTDNTEFRRKYKLENKFVILGVAAYWEEAKGLSNFIKLSKTFETDSTVILIGNLNKKIILPFNVIHIPQVNNPVELAEIYSASDVLVSLSKEESFGKVVAEALACGTPAVVYPTTACPEIVGNGCGYVAGSSTLSEIRHGIVTIKKNTKSSYSKNCRQFAEENFDLHQCTKKYCEVYQSLLTNESQE